MHIRYAVSTMVFWGREDPLSFEQECLFLKSLGFGVELLPTIKGHSECRYQRRNWPRLVEATRGMLVCMRSRSDKPTLEQWNEQIECARLLGANIVADLRSLHIWGDSQADGWDFAGEVVELAEQNGVKLCLETGQLPVLKRAGKKFDSIMYCLDTGYANVDLRYTFTRYVDDLADRVAHLHLTDNYGQTDDHEPPGLRGGIPREDWDYLLNALRKYDNDVVGSFEMGPCMPAVMLRQASEFLFDTLNWPNRPQNHAPNGGLGYNLV
ncbi:MAG TPA: sugar phosphate isomerase/epimerase [Sedimentisphaerales bacterium]|nr:sugar phosphate isomerase/epimerase [Sedimentisphaerales bacterium]